MNWLFDKFKNGVYGCKHLTSVDLQYRYSYWYIISQICHLSLYMLCECFSNQISDISIKGATVYPKKYAHGFCFAVPCCGYTLTDFPISIRLTSLALWQSNDCPSASKPTLMNMDKYFMWIHYERLYNHNKAKHNKIVCIFLGIYCIQSQTVIRLSTVVAVTW